MNPEREAGEHKYNTKDKRKVEIAWLDDDEFRRMSGTKRAWLEFRRNRLAMVGTVVIVFIALMGIFAPIVSTHDPYRQSLRERMKPPTAEHWLGTDELGRDFYSRLVYGARISLFVGIVGTAAGVFCGTIVGLISGFFGGWIDTLVMRVIDIMYAFPGILLAILVVAVLGPSLFNLIIVLAIWATPSLSRIVRGNVLSLKEQDYVQAARALGAGRGAHHVPAPAAEYAGADHRLYDAERRRLAPDGRCLGFPRLGRAAARGGMGQYPQQRPAISAQSASADDLPGRADLLDSDLDQSDR